MQVLLCSSFGFMSSLLVSPMLCVRHFRKIKTCNVKIRFQIWWNLFTACAVLKEIRVDMDSKFSSALEFVLLDAV